MTRRFRLDSKRPHGTLLHHARSDDAAIRPHCAVRRPMMPGVALPGALRMSAPLIPAATCVVLRPGPRAPEVLLVRREPRASFMPHLHVFPGGRVDALDAARPNGTPPPIPFSPGEPVPPWTDVLLSAAPMAAVRECFEESGVLLARLSPNEGHRGPRKPAVDPAVRSAVHRGEASFVGVCTDHGWLPALDRLVPFARWVTPEAEPRRFDTLFFAAEVPADTQAECDGRETVDHCWTTPARALDQHAAGELHLAPPTWAVLRDLVIASSCPDALRWAAGCRIVPIVPVVHHDEDERPVLLLPGDRLGPPARPLPSPAGTITRIYGSPMGWRGVSCPP